MLYTYLETKYQINSTIYIMKWRSLYRILLNTYPKWLPVGFQSSAALFYGYNTRLHYALKISKTSKLKPTVDIELVVAMFSADVPPRYQTL